MLEPLARRHDMSLQARTSADLPTAVSQWAADRAGNVVRFTTVDCGTGIPAEHLPHLFDRFRQANPQGRRGVGLGLAIAKAIVTGHGGTIGAESTAGEASEFWFELPVA